MEALIWLFTGSFLVILYSYFGHGLLHRFISQVKRSRSTMEPLEDADLPEVAIVITDVDGGASLDQKVRDCFQLNYPQDKIHLYIVTGEVQGSDEPYPNVTCFQFTGYTGQSAVLPQVMEIVKEPVTIFSDAGTMLDGASLRKMVGHFQNNLVGAVVGEKSVALAEDAHWLKEWNQRLHSVVGAADEPIAIRTALYRQPATLSDDYAMGISIVSQGYQVVYEPMALAYSPVPEGLEAEMQRKVRISASGLHALWRSHLLLNPFIHGSASFQYISERILRWALAPVALMVFFIANLLLAKFGLVFFMATFAAQLAFYALAALGYYLETYQIRIRGLFIPLYFTFMNLSIYLGLFKLISASRVEANRANAG